MRACVHAYHSHDTAQNSSYTHPCYPKLTIIAQMLLVK